MVSLGKFLNKLIRKKKKLPITVEIVNFSVKNESTR